MPYLASRQSPEPEQPPKPVTSYRRLILAVMSVVFAIGVMSVCVLSVTAA
jgi:hypothetical protein